MLNLVSCKSGNERKFFHFLLKGAIVRHELQLVILCRCTALSELHTWSSVSAHQLAAPALWQYVSRWNGVSRTWRQWDCFYSVRRSLPAVASRSAGTAETTCPALQDAPEQTCSFAWAPQLWLETGGSEEASGCCIPHLAVMATANRCGPLRFTKLHFCSFVLWFYSLKVLATFFKLIFDSVKPSSPSSPELCQDIFCFTCTQGLQCDLAGSLYFFLNVVCVWPYFTHKWRS